MGKDPRERVTKILESLKDKRKRFSERELEWLENFIKRGKLPVDFEYADRRRIDWILQFLENWEPEGQELEAKYQEYIDKYNNAEYGYYQAEKEMKNCEKEMEKNMIIRDLISLILQSQHHGTNTNHSQKSRKAH